MKYINDLSSGTSHQKMQTGALQVRKIETRADRTVSAWICQELFHAKPTFNRVRYCDYG